MLRKNSSWNSKHVNNVKERENTTSSWYQPLRSCQLINQNIMRASHPPPTRQPPKHQLNQKKIAASLSQSTHAPPVHQMIQQCHPASSILVIKVLWWKSQVQASSNMRGNNWLQHRDMYCSWECIHENLKIFGCTYYNKSQEQRKHVVGLVKSLNPKHHIISPW